MKLVRRTGCDSYKGKRPFCLFVQVKENVLFKDLFPCTTAIACHQDQLKAAHTEQEKKKKRESANREANRMRLQEHENKVRGALLDAFSKEDQERLQRNARKRLGEKD